MNFCPLSLQEEIAFHLFSVKFLQEKTIKADSQRSEVRLQKNCCTIICYVLRSRFSLTFLSFMSILAIYTNLLTCIFDSYLYTAYAAHYYFCMLCHGLISSFT